MEFSQSNLIADLPSSERAHLKRGRCYSSKEYSYVSMHKYFYLFKRIGLGICLNGGTFAWQMQDPLFETSTRVEGTF